MPIEIGAGHDVEARRIGDTSFWFSLLTAALVSALIIPIALLSGFSLTLKVSLLLISLLIISQQLETYFYTYYRIEMRFHTIGVMRAISALLQLAFAISLGLSYGVKGVIGGILAGQSIAVLLMVRGANLQFKPTIDYSILKALLSVGLSMLWINALFLVLASIGRIFILRWMGTELLGIYAVALLAVSLMAFVPGAVGQVVSPRVMRSYGQGDTEGLKLMLEAPANLLSLLLPVMGGLGALLMPCVVYYFLPEYASSVLPAQILLLSYTPFGLRNFATEILIANNQIHQIGIVQILGVALAVLIYIFTSYVGLGVVGIAAGTAAVYWFFGITIIVRADRTLGHEGKMILNHILKLILPSIWVIFVVVFLTIVCRWGSLSITSVSISSAMVGTLLLASSPLILYGWRRYQFYRGQIGDLPNSNP
jgi:O-antigen/teichoic acid export membrane protein